MLRDPNFLRFVVVVAIAAVIVAHLSHPFGAALSLSRAA
jgi:hypothetical protein